MSRTSRALIWLIAVLALSAAAQAAAFTWDGDTDGDFGTNTNYAGDPAAPGNAPGQNDTFTFAGNTNAAITVDDGGSTWQGIQSFDFTGATGAFSFTSNVAADDFEFNDGVANTITNPTALTHTFNIDIITGDTSFGITQNTAAGALVFNGTFTLNSALTVTTTTGDVTFGAAVNGGQAINIAGANSAIFDSTIADTSDVSVAGTATYDVNATDSIDSLNTIAGTTVDIANGVILTIGASNGDSSVAGVVQGAGGLTVSGTANTATLSGANTFTGAFRVQDSATATMDGTLADTVDVTLAGTATYDVNVSDTIDAVSAVAGTTIDLANGVVLTIGSNNGASVIAGDITGAGGLTTAGNQSHVLSGTNDYTGVTTVGGTSTLDIGAASALAANTTFTLSGGTLENSVAGLNFLAANTINLTVDSAITADATTILASVISGGANLALQGDSAMTLAGTNTLIGNVTITNTGATILTNAAGFGNAANQVDMQNGDIQLNVAGTPDIANPILASIDFNITVTQDAELSGLFTGAGGQRTVFVLGAGDLEISGINADATVDFATNPAYTGTVTLGDATDPNAAVASDFTVNGGTLQGIGTVGNDLTVNITGALAPGNSVGTINVGNDFTLADGAFLDIEIDPTVAAFPTTDGQAAPAGANDVVAAGNDVTIGDTATFRVALADVLNDATAAIFIPNGTIFTVITAGGGNDPVLVGDGPNITVTGLGMIDFAAAVNAAADTVELTAVRTSFADEATLGVPLAGNQVAVGRGLDSLGMSADADAQALLAEVATLGQTLIDTPTLANYEAYTAALNNLSPERYDILDRVNRRVTQAYVGVQADYLNTRRMGFEPTALVEAGLQSFNSMIASTQADHAMLAEAINVSSLSAADMVPGTVGDKKMGGFIRAMGAFAEEDNLDQRTGYEADTYGAQFGIDWAYQPDLLIGVAFAYANTSVDFEGLGGDADIDTIRFGPYLSWKPADDWYVDASLSYGFHMQESTRNVVVGAITRTATADFDGHDLALGGKAGVDLAPGEKFTLEPSIGLQYVLYLQDSFTESGAGAANLVVDSQTTNSLEFSVGVRGAMNVQVSGMTLVPEANIGYRHEFIDDNGDVNARFVGAASGFSINRENSDANAIDFGGGVSALVSDNASVFIRYDGAKYEDGITHAVSGGVILRF